MTRPKLIARAAVVAAMATAALVLPSAALAAPTSTNITAPTDGTFVTVNAQNPGSMQVTGTTFGGTGDVDLRCYYGTGSVLLESGVVVNNGAFSINLQLTPQLYAYFSAPTPYCVLRAVPTNSTPSAPPNQASPFQGPRLGWGSSSARTLGNDGAPNNPGSTVWDYFADRAQAGGYSDYYSAGNCGLCDTWVFKPGTYEPSQVIWWGNAALHGYVNPKPYTRSSVRVDGADVYSSGAVGFTPELRNNPGFPSVDRTPKTDPITGDLTIDESDQMVRCAAPATYPPLDGTCPAFLPSGITLQRKIVQNHQGRQVTITDHWKSTDGKEHQLDAIYADTNRDYTGVISGHHSLYDFAWTGAGFQAYPDGDPIAPPSSTPTTLYVKTDATTPDGGDGLHAFGALTYGVPPSELIMVHSANATDTVGEWHERYVRTIPATGELVITQVYSHDFSLASVQAMAHEAEQSLPPVSGPSSNPQPGIDPSQTAGSTSTTATTTAPAAAAVKCKVPKLRGRTLRTAKRLLLRGHCRLGKVTRKATTSVRSRRVIKSNPRAGSVRTRGARIAVVLAKRP